MIRFLTKHLMHWVSEEDILTFDRQGIKHRGRYLTNEQVDQLISQARIIQKSYFWKVLSSEIKYVAYLNWLKTGEDTSNRMLLRADEIINKRVNQLADLAKDK